MLKIKTFSKMLSAIMAMAVLAGGTGLNSKIISANTVSAALSGDLDSNGVVDVQDVALLQSYLANKAAFSDGINIDLNGDGTVNVFDLISHKRIAISTSVSDENYIHLNESYISVEGSNMELNETNNVVTITAGGTYYIDGTLTDGQIYVNAADTDKVSLVLNGVNVTCSTNAPIYVVNADETIINLAEGTENILNDTEVYTDAEADSTIYSKDDLVINGSGSLTVNSNYLYSVTSNDDLRISGGNVTVNHNSVDSSGAAVKGKNSVVVNGGTLKVTCAADDTDTGADGIISNDSTDETTGYIAVTGGIVNVNAKGGDAIKSKNNYVKISGGTVTAKAENDAVQAGTSIAVSGSAELYAYGKRSLTAGDGYTVDITGGSVVATSNEEFVNTSGITVDSMILNYTEKLDKQKIVISKNGSEVYSVTPDKKYTYALICNDALTDGTYNVYTGDVQMTHDSAATAGEFVKSGTTGTYNAVSAMGTVVVPADNTITLSNDGITFSGTGASLSADLKTITIAQPGTYIVTGEMEEGQIVVDVDKTTYVDATVELSLEGMSLTNTSTSPIYVASVDDKCSISAKNGTVNTISDGTAAYTNADADSGAIYSKDDLNFKGKGTLIVNGNYADAIVSKNDIKLNNGTIQVTAADDGIRGKDSVTIGDAADTDFSTLNITVNAKAGDGIKSTATDVSTADKTYGIVTVNGGTIDINAYMDGIQAEQQAVINGGDLNIYTFEGSTYSNSSSSGSTGGGMQDGNSNKTDLSAKGIKAVGLYDEAGTTWQSVGDITINGGNITIDSSDDSIHCGGSLNIMGGTMKLASADDALHSDHDLTLGKNGGAADDFNIYASKCYEGVEGQNIYQNSGTVLVKSDDDGYNAAGGADGSGNTNPGGFNPGGSFGTSGNYALQISGGVAIVQSASGDHDGFDSNGNLTVTGGCVIANGQEPLDSDGTNSASGGTVIAVSQGSTIPADTQFTIADASGNVIVSFKTLQAMGSITTKHSDTTVTAYTGGTISGGTNLIASDSSKNVYTNGTISGGTEVSQNSGGGQTGPGGWG